MRQPKCIKDMENENVRLGKTICGLMLDNQALEEAVKDLKGSAVKRSETNPQRSRLVL